MDDVVRYVLRISTINVQSLKSPERVQMLQHILEQGLDAVGVTEVMAPDGFERCVPGFDYSPGQDIPCGVDGSRYKGGVAWYVRSGIKWFPVRGEDHPCLHSIRIVRGQGMEDLYLAVFYCPPSHSAAAREECFAVLSRWTRKWMNHGQLLVVGDFNGEREGAQFVQAVSHDGLVCLNEVSAASVQDRSTLVPAPWSAVHMLPTASTGHVLDCVFVSPALVDDMESFQVWEGQGVGQSVHWPVVVHLKGSPALRSPTAEVEPHWRWNAPESKEDRKLYADISEEAFDAFEASLPVLDDPQAVEQCWTNFQRATLDSAAQSVGGKFVRHRAPSWWSSDLAELCRKKNSLARAAQKCRTRGDVVVGAQLMSEVRALKRHIMKASKEARKLRWRRVCEWLDESSDRVFWKYVRRFRTSPSTMPKCLKNPDGSFASDSDSILAAAAAFWQTTCSEESHCSEHWDEEKWQEMKQRASDILLGDPAECPEISESVVSAAMFKLDPYKASGVDGIMPWMIRFGGASMVRVLCVMFRAMWKLCYIPLDWKRALLVPIFKKGDPSEPSNYRPISLLSVPGKVFSRVINDILYDRLEAEGLLPEEQGGFRRERGCPEMIFSLFSIVECRKRKRLSTHLAFVDVKKAYDTVSRSGLALRLLELGTPSRVVSMVKHWYTGDSACVFMGGLRSDWFDISLGVKQGDISSPILFSCYINPVVKEFDKRPELGVDLGDGKKRVAILLFADDMVLFAENAAMLQEMLKVLSDFVDSVRLRVSTGPDQDKSAVMVYGASQDVLDCSLPFVLCREQLPVVEQYRYLGVMIHNEGSWEPQLSQLRSSVGLRISEMRSAGMHQGGLPVRRGRDLIRAEVNPVLEYASGVWIMSTTQVDKIVALWNKAARSAAGVPPYVSMASIIGDLDLLECLVPHRWMLYRVVMWHRLLSMDEDRIPKRCLRLWEEVQEVRRSTNWLSCVLEDLVKLRLVHEFNVTPQGIANVRALSAEQWLLRVREALLSQRIGPDWYRQVADRPWLDDYAASMRMPRYGFYQIPDTDVIIRKKQSIFQNYLEERNHGLRQFHTVFRAGSLPLQTCAQPHFRCGGELGSVKCFMCGSHQETLQHFVNECPAYSDIKESAGLADGPVDTRSLIRFPDLDVSRTAIKMLFDMWLRRIRTWRRSHPFHQRVQPLL